MQRPVVLLTLDPDCMNPLYGYMLQEIIQAWFVDFQNLRQQVVRWICTVPIQSAYLGPYSGRNWDIVSWDISELKFPNQYLVKGSEGVHLSFKNLLLLIRLIELDINSVSYVIPFIYSSFVSNASSSSARSDKDIIMVEAEHSQPLFYQLGESGLMDSPDNKSLVLHLDYDAFSKEALIDNGYVKCRAGDFTTYGPMLSPIDTTTFQILSLMNTCDD